MQRPPPIAEPGFRLEDEMRDEEPTIPTLPPEVLRSWVAHVSGVLASSVAAHSPAERQLAAYDALPSPWSEEP